MHLIWNYLLLITLCSYLFLEYYFAEVGLEGILEKVCSFFHFSPIVKLVALFLLDWIIISNLLFYITLTKEWNNISYIHFAGRLSPFVSSNTASNKKFSGKLFPPLFPFPSGRHRYSTYGFEDWLHDALSRDSLLSTSYGQRSMKCEWFRYETFKTYPIDGPSTPLRLAANGFYYTGTGHYVKCFCCGLKNANWPDSETVSYTHIRFSPLCPFANENPSTNVPINELRGNSTREGGSNDTARTTRNSPIYTVRGGQVVLPLPSIRLTQLDVAVSCYPGICVCGRCSSCNGGLRILPFGPLIVRARRFLWEQTRLEFVRNIQGSGDDIPENISEGRQETENRATHTSQTMRDDLSSSAARTVLSKGYAESIVKDAIASFRENNRIKPITTEYIMKYILETEPNLVTAKTDDTSTRRTLVLRLPRSNEDQERTASQSDSEEQDNQQELKRLRHENMCKICLDKDVDILFLPCAHHVSCEECAQSITRCAVCRTLIEKKIKIYKAANPYLPHLVHTVYMQYMHISKKFGVRLNVQITPPPPWVNTESSLGVNSFTKTYYRYYDWGGLVDFFQDHACRVNIWSHNWGHLLYKELYIKTKHTSQGQELR